MVATLLEMTSNVFCLKGLEWFQNFLSDPSYELFLSDDDELGSWFLISLSLLVRKNFYYFFFLCSIYLKR